MKREPNISWVVICITVILIFNLSGCSSLDQPVNELTPEGSAPQFNITAQASPTSKKLEPTETSPVATPIPENPKFDGDRAYLDVEHQVSFGPRLIGSEAHENFVNWATTEFSEAGWQVEVQETQENLVPIRNVIATRGEGDPWIILGAHYDSRFWADRDPDPEKQREPVPGANDGASGVAVLLELARVLPDTLDKQVWLVLFDAEDNGNIPGYDWIMGSEAFVKDLSDHPEVVVIVDMVGDADLNLYYEKNSDPEISQQIWDQAQELGYDREFIKEEKYSILDDHTPFLNAGIRAVDLIDFDYPFWHTTEDTADKVSPESLQAVGDTLLKWLIDYEGI